MGHNIPTTISANSALVLLGQLTCSDSCPLPAAVAPLSVYGLDGAYTGGFNISNVNVTTLLTADPSDFVYPSAVAINAAIVADPTVEWINTNGGTWTDAANVKADWSTGSLPGSGDDVTIDLPGSDAYTVTIPTGATATVESATVSSANATLLDQGMLALNGILTVSAWYF